MWRMFVVTALLAGCGDKAPALVTKQFAGFSVGLPRGTTIESTASSYIAGSVRHELRANTESIRIQWQRTAQTELNKTSEIAIAPPGMTAFTTKEQIGDDVIMATAVICDKRAVSIVTAYPSADAERNHRAIVTSFRCTPQAGELDKPPIEVIDLKLEKFTRHVQDQPALGFPTVTYQRDDKEAVVIVQSRPDVRLRPTFALKSEIEKQLAGMTNIKLDEKGEDLYFTAQNGQEPILGAATVKRCQQTSAYAFVVVMATSREIAEEILSGIARNAACLEAPRS